MSTNETPGAGSRGSSPAPAPLVVGVVPGQPDCVLLAAAEFARDLGSQLVCTYVDVTRYAAEFLPNGFMVTMPIDTDLPGGEQPAFPPELDEQVARVLDGEGVSFTTRAIAGDPADALGELAQSLGARALVVGTRERGFLASIEQLVNGSVGARLAHRQHKPVIVVPLAPSKEKTVADASATTGADDASEGGAPTGEAKPGA